MAHASKNNLINKESVLRKQQCKKNREKVNYDAFKKPVVQINPTDGSYINEFESVSEASRQLNIGNTAIQSVAKHDKYHKTAGGFVWIYKEEYDASADNRVKRTKYCKLRDGILNDYDKVIVNSKKIPVITDETVIDCYSFSELLDAQSTLQKPIIYYEIIRNQKSAFIIVDNGTVYRYILKECDLEY